jgi:hypothetical protein
MKVEEQVCTSAVVNWYLERARLGGFVLPSKPVGVALNGDVEAWQRACVYKGRRCKEVGESCRDQSLEGKAEQ